MGASEVAIGRYVHNSNKAISAFDIFDFHDMANNCMIFMHLRG